MLAYVYGASYIHREAANSRTLYKYKDLCIQATKIIHQSIDKRSSHAVGQWVKESLENGAGLAHKWTTQKAKAPPLPAVVEVGAGEDNQFLYSGPDIMGHYRQQWEGAKE